MTLIKHFDNFYANPEMIRQMALNSEFYHSGGSFKGLECRLPDLEIGPVMDRIASILGFHIEYSLEHQGIFRSLTAAQETQKVKQVHVDKIGFSGVLCLSNRYAGGSTTFYRHRETGLVDISKRDEVRQAAKRRRQSLKSLFADLDADGADLGKWELVESVEYVFNRLIIFDSNLFHVAGPGVGSTVPESKLSQNFWFYRYWPWKIWRQLLWNGRSSRIDARRPY
jgi:Family of unknown function (DUF6445)